MYGTKKSVLWFLDWKKIVALHKLCERRKFDVEHFVH